MCIELLIVRLDLIKNIVLLEKEADVSLVPHKPQETINIPKAVVSVKPDVLEFPNTDIGSTSSK